MFVILTKEESQLFLENIRFGYLVQNDNFAIKKKLKPVSIEYFA